MTAEFPNCCENCEYFLRLGDSKICNAQSQPTENASEPNECVDWRKIDQRDQLGRNQQLQSRVTQGYGYGRNPEQYPVPAYSQWVSSIPYDVQQAMVQAVTQNMTRLPLGLVDWYRGERPLTTEFWQHCDRYITVPGREYWSEPRQMIGQPDRIIMDDPMVSRMSAAEMEEGRRLLSEWRNETVQWSIESAPLFNRLEEERRRQETEDIRQAAETMGGMSQSLSDDQIDALSSAEILAGRYEEACRREEERRRSEYECQPRMSREETENYRRACEIMSQPRPIGRVDVHAVTRSELDIGVAKLPPPMDWASRENAPRISTVVNGKHLTFAISRSRQWDAPPYCWVYQGEIIID